MSTENCFNLVGDGDDVTVLTSIEQAFGIKISDAEATNCETFGQLFDVVWAKLEKADLVGLRCPSAVAFYKLRAGLGDCGFQGKITLGSELNAFFRQNGTKQTREKLAKKTGLELPHLRLTALSTAVLACIFSVGLIGSVTHSSWLPVFVSALVSAGLMFLLPKEFPRAVANMQGFTNVCTAWNFGQLASTCGGARSSDAWNALAIVVRESAGTSFNGKIDRETRFFPLRAA